MYTKIEKFYYWTQKVLPLVYDDSLSYYEVLSKVKNKLNEVIEQENNISTALEKTVSDVSTLKLEMEKLKNGDYDDIIIKAIDDAIKNVFFGLTDNGYFVAYIPKSWSELKFNTTGLDIAVNNAEYGRLVLSYE